MTDPIARFSNRVENYRKYRPGYPQTVVDLLANECGLTSHSIIADVGSGTGILSELFLTNGNRVFGVEPNAAMREASEKLLARYPAFVSLDGLAEATTLSAHSVDFITAGQAFHWFDRDRARTEFARISKPDGWVVLIWNERRLESTPFLRSYEELLQRYGTDYPVVRHENIYDDIGALFAPNRYNLRVFENYQRFDFEGVKGRMLSASYVPPPGHKNFAAMMTELRSIFGEHQKAGTITFEYDTKVYFGQLPN